MPSATGIVSDHFGKDRDRALGMFTSIFPIGGIVGPIIGGVFVAVWSWRGIFLVNVPIGIVLIVLAAKFIPAGSTRVRSKVDLRGIGLLGLLILSAMFGITYLGSASVTILNPVFLGCEAVAVGGARAVHPALEELHRGVRALSAAPWSRVRGDEPHQPRLRAGALGFATLVPLYAEDRFHLAPSVPARC